VRFDARLIEGYGLGLSETLGICTSNPLLHGKAKRNRIGLPLLGREIRVLEPGKAASEKTWCATYLTKFGRESTPAVRAVPAAFWAASRIPWVDLAQEPEDYVEALIALGARLSRMSGYYTGRVEMNTRV
jgi:acyl-CoA synthetase (AMP-forming)/AMP-acid ligase II